MNSEKDSNKTNPNKKTKTKKQNSNLSNQNLISQNIDKNEEFNLLNKKKKREEKESNKKSDKIEINQNMFNQYNIYQGLFIPPIGMPMQQINNKDQDYPEIYQKIYYINNSYEFLPNFPNGLEIKPCYQESKIENNNNLQDTINNIFKRGIVNHIIGAFFIEEMNDQKKDDEEISNNNNKLNKINKKEEPNLSNINKDSNNQHNKENANINDNKNKSIEPIYYNKNNENNSNNENKLKKPILIW